jgi:hypothetical protein
MEVATRWRALAATSGVSLALVGGGIFASGAPASRAHAAGTASCGNHSLTIEIESGEATPQKFKLQAKNVKASGLSCQAAFKFINDVYHSRTGTPDHYKCKTGKAKEPRGYFNQVCTHGSKKVEYGAQGG